MTRINEIKPLLISPLPPPSGGDSTWSERYLQYCNKKKIEIKHVNTALIGKRSENASDSFSLFDEIKRTFRIWKMIKKSIKSKNVNIAHLNTNCSPKGLIRDYWSSHILRKKHIPYIVHCRCNVQDQIKKSKIGLFFFRKMCSKSSRVLVQNSFSLDYLKTLGINQVILMPNHIESSYISENHSIRNKIEKIAFIGHIKKTKGVSEIVEVAKIKKGIDFYLVGPITEQELLHNANNIHFLGEKSLNEVKGMLDDSDVLLFPTYTEGFSNSLLEAMSRGLPSITTNVGANKDMIEDEGGIVLSENSVEDIIKALEIMDDNKVRQKMSIWCIEKVKRTYAIKIVFSKICSLYREVLDEIH